MWGRPGPLSPGVPTIQLLAAVHFQASAQPGTSPSSRWHLKTKAGSKPRSTVPYSYPRCQRGAALPTRLRPRLTHAAALPIGGGKFLSRVPSQGGRAKPFTREKRAKNSVFRFFFFRPDKSRTELAPTLRLIPSFFGTAYKKYLLFSGQHTNITQNIKSEHPVRHFACFASL